MRAAPGARAEDFLVVDCQLPGQIRQLGGRATYVTARRAIKTSGRDCEIRGGEYTAYDRTTRASSLRAWTALADQGDKNAQTIVGEIYERGYDVPPDYTAAAGWYKKAAEGGDARAATNLGALYERGLGVPRDAGQAVVWYRRAAGGAPGVTFEVGSGEEERLRREVAELRRQLDAKQKELEQSQQELDTLRKGLDQRRRDTDQERGAIATLRQELEESRKREQAGAAGRRDLERSIKEREAGLAAKDREAADLKTALERLQAERRQREQTQDQGVTQLRQTIAEREAQLQAREKDAAELRQSLARLQREQQAGPNPRDLERQITEREARLTAQTREMADLRATVARLETASAGQKAELDRLKKQSAEAPPDIQLIEPELIAFRGPEMRSATSPPRGTDRISLVGKVTTASGLTSFTINGRDEKVDGNGLFKTLLILKGGEDQVRIVAIDKAGRKTTLPFVVLDATRAATATPRDRVGLPRARNLDLGSYHALVIGNNEYKSLRRLRTAVNDATAVAKVLEQDYGFKVTLLTNANRYDTLSALNAARERLTEKDNLLIYYAGHGELDQVNQRGHWLPVDAEPGNTANWISNVTITDILNAMTVKQLIVVADSCYSGTMTRGALGQVAGGLSDDEKLRVLNRMVEKKSRMVLTSGGVEPVLDSVGGTHSVFAQNFMELLRANAGFLLGAEMHTLLQGRVIAGIQRRVDVKDVQAPEYAPIKASGHEAGDFVFARVAAR